MNKKLLLVSVFSGLIFFLAALGPTQNVHTEMSKTFESSSVPFKEIAYEPQSLGSLPSLCNGFSNENWELDLHFIVNASNLTGRYSNIFQTDDLNLGMRVEIDPKGNPSLVVNSRDSNPDKFVSISPQGVILENQSTRIKITVRNSIIEIKVGDYVPAVLEGFFTPTCNNIVIGGGYDDTRATLGRVEGQITSRRTVVTANFGIPMGMRTSARYTFNLIIVYWLYTYWKVSKSKRLNETRD